MTGTLPATLGPARRPLGLVVLQSDETIEADFRRLIPPEVELMVSRVPSAPEVTPDTLAAMEGELTASARLFPPWARFAALGYGCTSGTAEIGAAAVAARLRAGIAAEAVTDPVTALVAACQHLGIARLALVSPYIAAVSDRLRGVLGDSGIATPAFGSFDIAEEARVARIDAASLIAAAERVARQAPVDAVFLSCTNLRALDVVAPLEQRLGVPILSSNLALAWHMLRLSGNSPPQSAAGALFASVRA